jgi:metabolite-proton symporter
MAFEASGLNHTAAAVTDADAAGAARRTNSDARRVGLACGIGTAIERYDFFIYGTAAAVVFGPQFFPQVSELAGRLAAFATFALGFIALPLGGIVMGHFGDRLGRKSMLVWSLMLMGASTFAIGILPTYAQIGIWAPLLLVMLRFVQGFALGGEWAGAVLMSVEHAPAGRRGLYGSFVALGLPAGLVLANLVFLFATAGMSREQFLAWGWRVPFLASAVLVVVGLLVRASVPESPVFADVRARKAELRMPVAGVLRGHWRRVLLAAGSYLSISALGYIATVYFVSYATRELGLPLTTTLAVLVSSAIVLGASLVTFATWSDRWGRRRVMVGGLTALMVWSLIFFPLIDTKSLPLITLAVCGMMFLQGPYMGTQPAMFSELFPTTVRYSGASLGQTLGIILGGAIAPLAATYLFDLTRSSWPITTYLVFLSIISWLCGLGMTDRSRQTLSHE